MVRFADILTIVNGKNQKKVENPNGKYPIYGSGGVIGYADDYICEAETVVIGRKGNINNPIFVDTPFWNVDTAFGLCPNHSKLYPKYLYYFCINHDFERINTTVTIPSLTKANLLNVEIPLPPLDEQRRIAAVLDKVSGLIAKRRQQLEMLDELVKARFVEMFGDPLKNERGWDLLQITKVCERIFGGGTPPKSHPEYFKGTIPWVSPKDMKSCFVTDSIDHITETAVQNSTTNLVPQNSVLMVIRSGILKHDLPVAINLIPVTINQDMKAFIPNEKVTAEYLMYYFKAIEKDILSGVRGVTADNIDFKSFQSRRIVVPPIELQAQFSDFVRQVEKTKTTISHSLEKLETLKKSLMQEYFG